MNVLVDVAGVGVFLQPKLAERREDRQSQTAATMSAISERALRFDIFPSFVEERVGIFSEGLGKQTEY